MKLFLAIITWISCLVVLNFSSYAQCSAGCPTTYSTCANITGTTTVPSGTAGAYYVYCISPPAGCGNITISNFSLDQYSTVRICTNSPTDTVKFIGNFSATGGGSSAANDNTRRLEVQGNVQMTFGGTVNFNSRLVVNVASTGTLDLRPNPTGPNPFVISNSDSTVNNGKILTNGLLNCTGPISNRGTLASSGITGSITFASGVTNSSTGVITTSVNVTLGAGANVINYGSITSTGSFTSSAGSFFANKNYWHAIGNATFSGSYSNNAYFLSDGILTLNASGTLDVKGGMFESDTLILNSGTLSAGVGCAVFKVNKYSSIQSSGASATPIGSVGILDMSNPGQIDNVACGCGSTDADGLDNSITPPSGTQCSVTASPNTIGPYCGIIPITSLPAAGGCFATLPVKFLSVSVRTETTSNIINWTVEENESNLHYEVQYSSDGVSFCSAGVVNPVRIQEVKSYSFIHNNIATEAIYYRVKQVDKDGKVYYSQTVYTDAEMIHSNYIFPNPATDEITIYADDDLMSIEIISSNGELINIYNTSTTSTINISTYDKGVYFVRFNYRNSIEYTKLIVQ